MGKPKRKLSAHNKCMSRELKGNLSGKTKAQRQKIFSAAARKCSRETKKTSTSAKPNSRASPSRANPTGGNRTVKNNSFNMNKIYSLVRKAALVGPALIVAMGPGTPVQKGQVILSKYTGIWSDGSFHLETLRQGWEPFIWTSIVTAVIPKITRFLKGLVG